ncbi:Amidohydrolase 3 [Haloterrigena turkmenica DSM 5511]|uniref:Amidohydrolase 3 n=1 Tax=Haloterrigena turkmenica (strain ATCC 51198 / DSM 5511 / JCM 9101 / NCIMB 13204 / VKM B-1734 / 4k) TaxID=543526 RepID=D2RVR9_HALTV|nr:amidohydrolase [Haloterrigena turkmenica]ADB59433.1 Amidohydrolase 3 [Haloterrigena turkmenica DSM 5511]
MTDAADRLLVNAAVHTLDEPDVVHEAVAVRDGEIVRLGDSDEVSFLAGVETDVIDCEGRTVLPGFVDAHTHMEQLGQHLVHADLSAATSLEDCLETLSAHADTEPDREWVLGFGYDESEWAESRTRPLTSAELDRVSEDRPVVAMRVDLHTASLNSIALERLADDLPASDLRRSGGEPTGVAVEDAAEAVRRKLTAGREKMREVLAAATERAVELGVTGVHDKVRGSVAPRVYRDMAADGDLPLRVRIDYWSDHLEALEEVGLATNAGGDRVRTGAIKSFSDGSFGSRTARLREPYVDASTGEADVSANEADGADTARETEEGDDRGQWVVDPEDLAGLIERADGAGYQVCVHAIGDAAIEETLSALESTADPGGRRHRIEHAELATDDQIERMAEAGIVASMQPNFHRWADEGGLYDRRLGRERRDRTNRFRRVLEAGVPLAFGSDCMPLNPLLGIHYAVNAPTEAQRLSVTDALRAYTRGAAYAGFDEDRLGTVEVGKRADLVVLEASPWEQSDWIDEIDVAMTMVDGDIVFDGFDC